MKENIEEDLKKTENLIECFRKAEIVNLECKESMYQRCNYSHYKAIEHILSDYKRVVKENEELKDKWDKDTHKLQNDLDIANAKRIDWEKAYQEENDKQFDLLKEILKLQEENEKLKVENDILKTNYSILKGDIQKVVNKLGFPEDTIISDEFIPMINENYFPKEKIQDKIEELEEKRIKMEKDDIGVGFTLGEEWSDLKSKIKAYKELLEEKGE